MKIYFVRHGKTEWNLERRFQGNSGDSPLLATSIDEIKACGDYLADINFDKVFSSDSGRAVTTAELIMSKNKYQKDIEFSERIREWNYGKLEGTKIERMKDMYPTEFYNLRNNLSLFDHHMFEAESAYQATTRFINFLKELKGQPYQNVLIVSHGAILTGTIRTLLGIAICDLRKNGSLDNGSVSVLETTDFENFKLLRWNDTNYRTEEA